jgi:hypothetical protein
MVSFIQTDEVNPLQKLDLKDGYNSTDDLDPLQSLSLELKVSRN